MFLIPGIGGPDTYGAWTCVLFDENKKPSGIGLGPTEDDAILEAKEHVKRRRNVGEESVVVLPIYRQYSLIGAQIKDAVVDMGMSVFFGRR